MSSEMVSTTEERASRPIVNTVRFRITPSLANALHVDSIKRRARGALVPDVRFDCELKRGELRVACSMAMAIFFIEELGALSAKAAARRDHGLVTEASRAVTATIKAIDDVERSAAVAPRATGVVAGVENRA